MNPYSGQKRIAFGYNRDTNQIVLHIGQAAAVQLIYQLYAEGQSIADIVRFLENVGIPSPQNKLRWGKQALANILSNPHYVGDSVYPQIIEPNLFTSVQALRACSKYFFHGKISKRPTGREDKCAKHTTVT